jgi:thymidylate synthase
MTSRRPAINPAFALAEVIWIVCGRRDSKFLTFFNSKLSQFSGDSAELHGAYGHRLRHHFGLDQLTAAYHTLIQNPDSRQVVLQIWDPAIDFPSENGSPKSPDIPCNTQSYLKIRNGKLEWTQIMRSNDVFLGTPHNIIQFTMLQEVMSGWLNIDVGTYNHLSDSLHIYEHNWNKLRSADTNTLSTEDIRLAKPESDRAFSTLSNLVESIINLNTTGRELEQLLKSSCLPEPYHNMGSVLVAEGLRRRGERSASDRVISACTNTIYRRLWQDWSKRVDKK